MRIIQRDSYLNKLIDKKNNGLVKIITGIRRCGKSFLLDPIFIDYLKSEGVDNNHIIKIELDNPKYEKFYNNSESLYDFIKIKNKLVYKDYNVDVGVVPITKNRIKITSLDI